MAFIGIEIAAIATSGELKGKSAPSHFRLRRSRWFVGSVFLHGGPESMLMESVDIHFGLFAMTTGDDGPTLFMDVEHQLGGLFHAVAKEFLEYEGHITHQVDGVIPDQNDPRAIDPSRFISRPIDLRTFDDGRPGGDESHAIDVHSFIVAVCGPFRTPIRSRSMSVGSRPLVPSRLAPGGVVSHGSRRQPTTVFGGYIALMKLRVVELLLITTVPTMVLAEKGWPSWSLVGITLLGGTLAAGGANAINMVVDRDIDALMERTKTRPLVTGLIAPRAALIFAIGLEIAAFAVLWVGANFLSAVLALSATLFYVFIYTLWLKRTSKQNIVIGGAAGAVPVLVGWAAVENALAWEPVILFLVIFLWTPPHFWALAIRHADEYRAAGVPMLPTVVPMRQTINQMVVYSVAFFAVTLVLVPVADLGWIYLISAVVLGIGFTISVVDLGRDPTAKRSMRVFALSITYITVLFVALAADVLVRHGL